MHDIGLDFLFRQQTEVLFRQQFDNIKSSFAARHWWLMPVILATQEAEIRRITVQSQLRQRVHKTLT
jgi:hypothetical protein